MHLHSKVARDYLTTPGKHIMKDPCSLVKPLPNLIPKPNSVVESSSSSIPYQSCSTNSVNPVSAVLQIRSTPSISSVTMVGWLTFSIFRVVTGSSCNVNVI